MYAKGVCVPLTAFDPKTLPVASTRPGLPLRLQQQKLIASVPRYLVSGSELGLLILHAGSQTEDRDLMYFLLGFV